VFLRLRILEGVPSSWVEAEHSALFVASGLLLENDDALVPTEHGIAVVGGAKGFVLLLNELILALAG
jgi:hypothetical protein